MMNDPQKYIDTARDILACTTVPKKRDYWNYEDGSDTNEAYLEKLRVARNLISRAMKEGKA